jgi:hypothetical protein
MSESKSLPFTIKKGTTYPRLTLTDRAYFLTHSVKLGVRVCVCACVRVCVCTCVCMHVCIANTECFFFQTYMRVDNIKFEVHVKSFSNIAEYPPI